MEDIKLLINLHKNNQRQGPGSSLDTIKAFDLTGLNNHKHIDIADIGCGTGAQTITLAQYCNCTIQALDLFPEFLLKLKENAKNLNLSNKISTIQSSMDKLPFRENEFDLIRGEGSIYNIGFENGIKYRKNFLKKDGYIAISEISWLTDSRPIELENHRTKEYPEIDTISNKIKILKKNGYSQIKYFVLDKSCRIENYYKPLENSFDIFLEQNNHSEIAKNIIENERKEISMYHKYEDYYSYAFYIAKNIS